MADRRDFQVAVSKNVLTHVFDVVCWAWSCFSQAREYPTSRAWFLAEACST